MGSSKAAPPEGWPVFIIQGNGVKTVQQGWMRGEEKEIYWVSRGSPGAEPEAFPKGGIDEGPRFFVHVELPVAPSIMIGGILSDDSGHTIYKDFLPLTGEEIDKVVGIFGKALGARCQAYRSEVLAKQLRWVRIVGSIGVTVTGKWTAEQLNAVFARQGFL